MGAHITMEQVERLKWMHSRIRFPRIVLFLDRDQAGRDGAQQALERLRGRGYEVSRFDWDRESESIPDSIQDPADMPVERLQHLHNQGAI